MLTVQCDFDDTITVGNVSSAIRQVFAPAIWTSMEEEYLAGDYSVEESNIRQFALVKAHMKEIQDFVLGEVVVRYAFDEFVEYCRGEGIRLVIVSSGLDFYIEPIISQLGLDHLEIHSGSTVVTESGIQVKYTDPHGTLITKGFKESYIRHFKKKGNPIVYIGDGFSDIVPAIEADFVIARAELEDHFRTRGLPHRAFNTFTDVGRHVDEIRQGLKG